MSNVEAVRLASAILVDSMADIQKKLFEKGAPIEAAFFKLQEIATVAEIKRTTAKILRLSTLFPQAAEPAIRLFLWVIANTCKHSSCVRSAPSVVTTTTATEPDAVEAPQPPQRACYYATSTAKNVFELACSERAYTCAAAMSRFLKKNTIQTQPILKALCSPLIPEMLPFFRNLQPCKTPESFIPFVCELYHRSASLTSPVTFNMARYAPRIFFSIMRLPGSELVSNMVDAYATASKCASAAALAAKTGSDGDSQRALARKNLLDALRDATSSYRTAFECHVEALWTEEVPRISHMNLSRTFLVPTSLRTTVNFSLLRDAAFSYSCQSRGILCAEPRPTGPEPDDNEVFELWPDQNRPFSSALVVDSSQIEFAVQCRLADWYPYLMPLRLPSSTDSLAGEREQDSEGEMVNVISGPLSNILPPMSLVRSFLMNAEDTPASAFDADKFCNSFDSLPHMAVQGTAAGAEAERAVALCCSLAALKTLTAFRTDLLPRAQSDDDNVLFASILPGCSNLEALELATHAAIAACVNRDAGPDADAAAVDWALATTPPTALFFFALDAFARGALQIARRALKLAKCPVNVRAGVSACVRAEQLFFAAEPCMTRWLEVTSKIDLCDGGAAHFPVSYSPSTDGDTDSDSVNPTTAPTSVKTAAAKAAAVRYAIESRGFTKTCIGIASAKVYRILMWDDHLTDPVSYAPDAPVVASTDSAPADDPVHELRSTVRRECGLRCTICRLPLPQSGASVPPPPLIGHLATLAEFYANKRSTGATDEAPSAPPAEPLSMERIHAALSASNTPVDLTASVLPSVAGLYSEGGGGDWECSAACMSAVTPHSAAGALFLREALELLGSKGKSIYVQILKGNYEQSRGSSIANSVPGFNSLMRVPCTSIARLALEDVAHPPENLPGADVCAFNWIPAMGVVELPFAPQVLAAPRLASPVRARGGLILREDALHHPESLRHQGFTDQFLRICAFISDPIAPPFLFDNSLDSNLMEMRLSKSASERRPLIVNPWINTLAHLMALVVHRVSSFGQLSPSEMTGELDAQRQLLSPSALCSSMTGIPPHISLFIITHGADALIDGLWKFAAYVNRGVHMARTMPSKPVPSRNSFMSRIPALVVSARENQDANETWAGEGTVSLAELRPKDYGFDAPFRSDFFMLVSALSQASALGMATVGQQSSSSVPALLGWARRR